MSSGLLALLAMIFTLILWAIYTYNSLISKQNDVKNIRSSVDVWLKKRYDLIPNLVLSVKEYMVFEKETLSKITELRSLAMSAKNGESFELNSEISSLLNGIKVAFENYPELKANENFLHLQKSLNEIEEQLSAARRAYNASVMIYNNYTQMLPSGLIANLFNFKKESFFEILSNERENPNVKDLFR
ncbi:LemA family protein [Campylobacter gastrosuis]|uniref:LemA family protein n=1 Tax=Campylobacter gastrosuis TaxID=2974576 RepID=A0ABT7HMT8_9BACT|nr:LemA family protein [Campylobacter gastrosuis]MDL0088227.1 LemA family protein [Campylobacter gastrosuis]